MLTVVRSGEVRRVSIARKSRDHVAVAVVDWIGRRLIAIDLVNSSIPAAPSAPPAPEITFEPQLPFPRSKESLEMIRKRNS